MVEAWLKDRRNTHRSADQDEYRWLKHLAPTLGRHAPDDVDVAMLKKIVAVKLADGLSPATLLVAWKAKNPNPFNGLVCPPILGMLGKAAPGPQRRHLGEHRITKFIKQACKKAKRGKARQSFPS